MGLLKIKDDKIEEWKPRYALKQHRYQSIINYSIKPPLRFVPREFDQS